MEGGEVYGTIEDHILYTDVEMELSLEMRTVA